MRTAPLIVFALCWVGPLPAQNAGDPSRLTLVDSACAPGICRCRGAIDSTGTIAANGVDHRALRVGVPCLAADFDGNGTTDVALTGGEGMAVIVRRTPDGALVPHVIDAGGLLELYGPRTTVGPHGEPRSAHHGLLVRDVGRSHVIFLWDGARFAPTRLAAWNE